MPLTRWGALVPSGLKHFLIKETVPPTLYIPTAIPNISGTPGSPSLP